MAFLQCPKSDFEFAGVGDKHAATDAVVDVPPVRAHVNASQPDPNSATVLYNVRSGIADPRVSMVFE